MCVYVVLLFVFSFLFDSGTQLKFRVQDLRLSSEYEICNELLGPDLSLFTQTVSGLHFVSAFQPGHHVCSARCEWSCGHGWAGSQYPETVCCHLQRWVGVCLSWSRFLQPKPAANPHPLLPHTEEDFMFILWYYAEVFTNAMLRIHYIGCTDACLCSEVTLCGWKDVNI